MLRCTHVANVSFLNLLAVLLVNGLTGKRVDKLQKKVVLYSSANEYYTQVAMSTMLKCGWVLCSSGNEYYALFP